MTYKSKEINVNVRNVSNMCWSITVSPSIKVTQKVKCLGLYWQTVVITPTLIRTVCFNAMVLALLNVY